MIITEEVEIRGKIKRVLELKPYSHTKVEVACDFCGNRKITSISNHTQSCDRDGKYYCYKCRWIKYEKTCLEKYGFKNASSHEDIKEIRKKSIKEKYNCENVFQLETSKQKKQIYLFEKIWQRVFRSIRRG